MKTVQIYGSACTPACSWLATTAEKTFFYNVLSDSIVVLRHHGDQQHGSKAVYLTFSEVDQNTLSTHYENADDKCSFKARALGLQILCDCGSVWRTLVGSHKIDGCPDWRVTCNVNQRLRGHWLLKVGEHLCCRFHKLTNDIGLHRVQRMLSCPTVHLPC